MLDANAKIPIQSSCSDMFIAPIFFERAIARHNLMNKLPNLPFIGHGLSKPQQFSEPDVLPWYHFLVLDVQMTTWRIIRGPSQNIG